MKDATTKYWARAVVQEGCWGWSGTVNSKGYATMKEFIRGAWRPSLAHRISYELQVGPIPAGMFVDHACHTRACTNPHPKHLRLATNKQNQENRAGANRNSKSGVRGVSWNKERRKWLGIVSHNGKNHSVGRFDSIEAAEQAVIAKRRELFTHA